MRHKGYAKYHPSLDLEGLKKDHRKHLNQYRKSPVLNPGSSKYEAQVLPP